MLLVNIRMVGGKEFGRIRSCLVEILSRNFVDWLREQRKLYAQTGVQTKGPEDTSADYYVHV